MLRKYGWRTAAFYPPAVFFIDGHKLKTYADSNFDFEYVKFEFIDAQKRVDQVLAYYADTNPQRSFVWIHFFEPHEPYQAHDGHAFGGGDVDRYDSEIAYTDAAVGRLIASARKRRPGTIVILTADHGEEFDEHGGRYHGSTLYDEQVHVPLIISVPGVPPHVVDGQVELVDLVPTVLTLLDIPVPARMRGTDLGPWLAGQPAPASRLPPAFAELEDKRMIVSGTNKLLCDLQWGTCAYYDLAADPREQRNLAEERPERAAALRAQLDEWLDGHVKLRAAGGPRSTDSSDPTGEPVPRAIERGRLGDVLAGARAGGAAGADATRRSGSGARRRRCWWRCRAQAETAAALARAAADPDRVVADWAAVGATRLGDATTRARVRGDHRGRVDRSDATDVADARGAGAGGARRRARRAGAGQRPGPLRRRAAVPDDHRQPRQAARPARGAGARSSTCRRCRTGARWSRRWATSAIRPRRMRCSNACATTNTSLSASRPPRRWRGSAMRASRRRWTRRRASRRRPRSSRPPGPPPRPCARRRTEPGVDSPEGVDRFEPVQVVGAAVVDREGEDLGDLVRVQLQDAVAGALEHRRAGLDQAQDLVVLLQPPVPLVDRPHARDDVHAGGQPLVDQRARQRRRPFLVRHRDVQLERVRHRATI